MAVSERCKSVMAELPAGASRVGPIKAQAKAIGRDHDLAQELWSTGEYPARLLAVLLLDRKELDQAAIDDLVADMATHSDAECNRLSEWFMANQLMKSRPLTQLITGWQNNETAVLRRLFWYHQARLRWTGQAPPGNSAALMDALERGLAGEVPIVQWAMNFCAAQIGIREPQYRARCIRLGEETGLYKEERAPRNCTPNYLPEAIRIEVAKLEA